MEGLHYILLCGKNQIPPESIVCESRCKYKLIHSLTIIDRLVNGV